MATRKTKATKQPQERNDGHVAIPIVRYLPPDIVTHFADSMIVTHTENEFIISFLQSQFPLASGQEELAQVDKVVSKCVARVVVTPKHMEQIVDALQHNLVKQKSLPEGE